MFMNRKIFIGAAKFAMLAIVAFSLISSVSAISRRDAILEFVDACQMPVQKEGYYGSPENNTSPEKVTTLENTFAALEIIGILRAPITNASYPDALSIRSFLADLINSTGGVEDFDNDGNEFLSSTFQALQISKDLNITYNRTSLNNHMNFTVLSQNANGGFGANPSTKSNPSIFNSYYALKILNFTGNLTDPIKNQVKNFVLSCNKSDYLFSGNPDSSDTSIAATAFAAMIYKEFFPEELTNVFAEPMQTSFLAYLTSHQGADGGFFDMNSSVPLLSTTYYAVKACSDINIDIPGGDQHVIDWILSRQNFDGGFVEGTSPTTRSSMLATSFAVMALNMVRSSMDMLNGETAFSLSQIGGIVAVLVLLGVIVLLIVIAYYAKKRNRI